MERGFFCNKEGSLVCINCSSFSNSSSSHVLSIMDLGSLSCVINRVNTIDYCLVSVTSGT